MKLTTQYRGKKPTTHVKLNSDRDSIHEWSRKQVTDLNPNKTESMTISRKHIKPNHPYVFIQHVLIKAVSEHKRT